MRHVAIIPARNEERFLEGTLRSLLAQTEPPDLVYVVDDGSTDRTPDIVRAVAAESPSVRLLQLPPRAKRQMGGGVVRAFDAAYQQVRHLDFAYVSKLDADLVFPPDYFERVLGFLDAHPDHAAAGGVPVETIGGREVRWRVPAHNVPGPLKTVRKDVYDRMGGFIATLGWDIVDLVKMRSLGYRTTNLDIPVRHLRQHGSAEGRLRGKAQWGEGAWIIGSHPLFVAARGLYRMAEAPYVLSGLAFWWGYLAAALRRRPRLADRDLVRALRREQVERLLRFNRLAG
ncbi:MAG TPA: glycosyltransferase family A protein [Longimicrobium sp.]